MLVFTPTMWRDFVRGVAYFKAVRIDKTVSPRTPTTAESFRKPFCEQLFTGKSNYETCPEEFLDVRGRMTTKKAEVWRAEAEARGSVILSHRDYLSLADTCEAARKHLLTVLGTPASGYQLHSDVVLPVTDDDSSVELQFVLPQLCYNQSSANAPPLLTFTCSQVSAVVNLLHALTSNSVRYARAYSPPEELADIFYTLLQASQLQANSVRVLLVENDPPYQCLLLELQAGAGVLATLCGTFKSLEEALRKLLAGEPLYEEPIRL